MKAKVEKKGKRYFCDYFEMVWTEPIKALIAIFIYLILVSGIIVTISSLCLIAFMYEYELNIYPEDSVNKVEEISNNLIIEGTKIDLEDLAEVDEYEIVKDNDNIIITYSYKNKRLSAFSPINIEMTLKLSNDYHIISKEATFSSREDYSEYIKQQMIKMSLVIGIIVAVLSSIPVYRFFESMALKSEKRNHPDLYL